MKMLTKLRAGATTGVTFAALSLALFLTSGTAQADAGVFGLCLSASSIGGTSSTYNGGTCSASYGAAGTFTASGAGAGHTGTGFPSGGVTATDSGGNASAFGDIASGILRDKAVGIGQAFANTILDDTLHFIITDSATTANITVTAHMGGTNTGTGSYGDSMTLLFGGASFGWSTTSNPPQFGTKCGGCAPLGWVSTSFTNETASGFDFTGVYQLNTANLTTMNPFVNLGLSVGCTVETCDYSNTGTINLILPSDVKYTSDSGVFLTAVPATVPEPSSWTLLSGGLMLAGYLMRKRNRAGSSRDGAPPEHRASL